MVGKASNFISSLGAFDQFFGIHIADFAQVAVDTYYYAFDDLPLTAKYIAYSDVVPVIKSRLSFAPPKQRLETTSGILIFPINNPSGAKQYTPSPPEVQTRS